MLLCLQCIYAISVWVLVVKVNVQSLVNLWSLISPCLILLQLLCLLHCLGHLLDWILQLLSLLVTLHLRILHILRGTSPQILPHILNLACRISILHVILPALLFLLSVILPVLLIQLSMIFSNMKLMFNTIRTIFLVFILLSGSVLMCFCLKPKFINV